MKQIITILALLPLSLFAQETFEVEAGGSTSGGTPPYYDPMELTIEVGDIVHWEAVSGTHNVYAMHDMFPDNPEEFTSGEPDNDLDYSHTFTIPGVYEYHCTQTNHAQTQHGMITVTTSQNVEENTDMGRLLLYPVPSNGHLTLELAGNVLRSAQVFSVDGRALLNVALNGADRHTIDLDGLATGRYLLRLTNAEGRTMVRPFLKN